MTQDLIVWQKPDGREWESRVIKRIQKMTVYVPEGALSADKIVVVDRLKLKAYVEAEGYGKE